MSFLTVKEIIESLPKYYKETDKLLVYWWDKESVSDYINGNEFCVDETRIDEIWDNAGDRTDSIEEYGLNSIQDTLTDQISDQLTTEEREHYGCIEVVVDGKTIHKEMEELPAESDEGIAEENESE